MAIILFSQSLPLNNFFVAAPMAGIINLLKTHPRRLCSAPAFFILPLPMIILHLVPVLIGKV
jgi:hypothetical protein